MSNELQVAVIDPKEFGLESEKATTIMQSFTPKIVERDGCVEVYNQILTKELTKETCEEASTLRKKLVKVRTGIADIHKTEKAFYLASGRYVDALKNKLTLPVEQMEEQLSKIEQHFENIEKERIQKLNAERCTIVAPYVEDTTNLKLSDMEQDVFEAYVTAKKTAYEAKIAAEQKAEAERLAQIEAEKAEQERIRQENEALKAEAEKKAKELEAERAAALEKQRAIEAEAQKERERLQKIADEEKAAQDKIIAQQKAEAEKLAKELQAEKDKAAKSEQDRKNAELAAQKEQEAAELKAKKEAEKAAKAPVKEKMTAWVNGFTISGIGTEKMTPEQLEVANLIMSKFESYKAWAKSEIEKI
jgi:hypothetical protein